MLSRRNLVMVASSAGAVVALAGCGGGGSSTTGSSDVSPSASPSTSASTSASTPLAAVQSAYSSTIGKKSARIGLVEHVSAAGHQINAVGSGVDDFAAKKLDLTTKIAGAQIEIRKVGPTLYERLPSAASAGLPGHTPWVSIDLSSLLKHTTGGSLSQLEAGQQDDPASILAYLKQASSTGLHKVGTATIRGTSTTEYTANIDLNKVAAAEGPKLGALVKNEVKILGTSTYPISVWVDSQGLVRQMSYHLSVSPTTSLGGSSTPQVHVKIGATIQFYDFGTTVAVTAPPASQTTDITKQVQGLASGPLAQSGAPSKT